MTPSIPMNYAGISSPYCHYQQADYVILPVPFDKTSTWLKGSRKGPKAIITASRFMELYDIETNSEPFKKGIFTAKKIKARKVNILNQRIYGRVKEYLNDGKYTILLGGEHSVSLGSILAHLDFYPRLSVLHLDAHADLREQYDGDPYNHACVMARVKEKVKNIFSIGIRSMDGSEIETLSAKNWVSVPELIKGDGWIKKMNQSLSDEVYLTIDLDVFDPAVIPSTGTPEPGGLTWFHVLDIIKQVIKSHRLVGFDVVELCPSRNKAPDYLAAKLIYKTIALINQINERGVLA